MDKVKQIAVFVKNNGRFELKQLVIFDEMQTINPQIFTKVSKINKAVLNHG